jgi:calcium-dependent protein kinase
LVQKAINKETRQQMAIKRVPKNNLEITSMIRHEIAIMALFDHPNIVKYYGFRELKWEYFIEMEFVDGDNLPTLLNWRRYKLQPFSEDFICYILAKVSFALFYVHQQHIIHLDIKPENIIHSFTGEIKLIDFGLSIISNLNEFHNIIAGTPPYESPEMLCLSHSFPIDIWSLGITIYELMTFKFPFYADDYDDNNKDVLYNKILNDPIPTINHDYSNDLKQIVYSMLNQYPITKITLKEVLFEPIIQKHLSNSDIRYIQTILNKQKHHHRSLSSLSNQNQQLNNYQIILSKEERISLSKKYFLQDI